MERAVLGPFMLVRLSSSTGRGKNAHKSSLEFTPRDIETGDRREVAGGVLTAGDVEFANDVIRLSLKTLSPRVRIGLRTACSDWCCCSAWNSGKLSPKSVSASNPSSAPVVSGK